MRRRVPGRAARASGADFTRIVAVAANPVLAPLDCRQKGRSALWIADQGFWAILVDFKPQTLTVGASFLWWVQSQWSFDHGQRIADLGGADAMARRAAEEVAGLRAKFQSVAAIARHLVAAAGDASWPLYHAAVAAGLAGERATAARLFQRLVAKPMTRDWEAALAAEARGLAQRLDEPAAFRDAVAELVNRMRALQGLPRDPDCVDGAKSP